MNRFKGRTLIEMIIVISIIAILSMIVIPSFVQQIKNDRLKTTANQLHSVYKYARSEAVKREKQINLIAQAGDWLVQLSGETLAVFSTKHSSIYVNGLANLTIVPTGTTTTSSYLITDDDSSTNDYRLCVFISGQSLLTTGGNCP